MCYLTLENITTEQLEDVFTHKKVITTQDGFILYIKKDKFYLSRNSENGQFHNFLIELNLANHDLIDQFIHIVDRIVQHYEKNDGKQNSQANFLFIFDTNDFHIHFHCLVQEVMDIASFLLTLIRFLYITKYKI